MSVAGLPAVSGFVLAGGKSSRMGRNKALLELGGKPLVGHAVEKLGRLCESVAILSNDAELGGFGELVEDVHPGCGPLGGVEAALLRSTTEWSLILPVDVPFLPTYLLADWLWKILCEPVGDTRIAMLAVDRTLHPALLIVHRDVAPFLTYSLERGHYRLLSALEYAAEKIANRRSVETKRVLLEWQWDFWTRGDKPAEAGSTPTEAQRRLGPDRWFANLNTPEDFLMAERDVDGLDTL